jgi:hypothetical protein
MLESSRYISAFHGLDSEVKDDLELIADAILVEFIPDPEVKTKSGLLLQTKEASNDNWRNSTAADKPVLVRALKVGKGYYDNDTDETIPLNCSPGDILLVGRQSTKWFSHFAGITDYSPNTIGLTRESEIQARFVGGDKAYEKVSATLNKHMGVNNV